MKAPSRFDSPGKKGPFRAALQSGSFKEENGGSKRQAVLGCAIRIDYFATLRERDSGP
jgi:hypothetical protein